VASSRDAPRFAVVWCVTGFGAGGLALGSVSGDRVRSPPVRAVVDGAGGSALLDPVTVEGVLVEDAAPSEFGAVVLLRVASVDRASSLGAGDVIRLAVGGAGARNELSRWTAGRRIRAPATLRRVPRYFNPGVQDQEILLARTGVALVGTIKSAALVEIVEPASRWREAIASVRAHVRRLVRRTVGPWSLDSAGIVTAVLIGDRAGLDDRLTERLQRAGTYHVIAISGGNIAILCLVFLAALGRAGVPASAAAAVAIPGIAAYGLLAGGGPSVVRASFVAIVYLSAKVLDHRASPLNAVAVAGLVLVALRPLDLLDVGFQLSFGATLGILLGIGPVSDRIGLAHRGPWVTRSGRLAAATLCAEAALVPLMARTFSQVTFAGLVLNFLAIPLMTIVQVAGGVAVVLGTLAEPLALAPGWAAHAAARGLVESARFADLVPILVMKVPPPAAIVLVAYYSSALMWIVMPSRGWVRRGAGVAFAMSSLTILVAPAKPQARGGWLSVTFLDVDQGDATLIRFPEGASMLVDAGGVPGGRFDVGGRVVSPALWSLGIRRLDFLVLTHGDPDHIGGAEAIVRDFRPREIWEGVPVPSHEPTRALRLAADPAVVWRALRAGEHLDVGGVAVDVRHPPAPDWERQKVRNDDSVVLELTLGEVSFLLTGDIGESVEAELASRLPRRIVRILKVPHHGSRTSSSEGFLRQVAPTIAVVSAGRANRFGHPAPEVLDRYVAAGTELFRTDRDGAVTIETNGTTLRLQTMAGRSQRFGVPGILTRSP
jgi:competence protein ComEC